MMKALMTSLAKTISTTQWVMLTCVFMSLVFSVSTHATTPLADKPIATENVYGNVAIALSVEWPTGITSAYKADQPYKTKDTYDGLFDSEKCYAYQGEQSTLAGGFYNTGVDNNGNVLANNVQDPHWTIVSFPSGISNKNRKRLDNLSGSGNSNSAGHIGWNAGSLPAGQYTWQSDLFTFPANVNPRDVSVSFEIQPDDQFVDILINGVSTGINAPTANWYTSALVTIPKGSFSAQSNRLSIVVKNTGGPTGLRIDNMQVKNEGQGQFGSYFVPVAYAKKHSCMKVTNGRWSGNFLNWAITQVIDPFRKVLTGGHRTVDEVGMTILEKAYADGQGGKLAADKSLDDKLVTGAGTIKKSTPFDKLQFFKIRISGLGTKFYITGSEVVNLDAPTSVISGTNDNINIDLIPTSVYEMQGRVRACVPSLLEENCKQYPNGDYKPTGLMHEHADKLRFSVFGYLNDNNIKRDGGVMRARMSSIGPDGEYPEWDANTGIFLKNPNPTDAAASGVNNSGAINYLNQFGLTAPGYKSFDPLSELYYAVGRYFRKKGNVKSYTDFTGLSNDEIQKQKDGFPVITNWDDPIRYSCESNFIIGLSDTNTWADANLPGSTIRSGSEPPLPPEANDDYGSLFAENHFTDVYTSTKRVGDLEGFIGLQSLRPYWCCGSNSYFISGLAYDLHTRDFRPDIVGKQTISTYWLDVLEAGFIPKNQMWLAAKYGGFDVSDDFEPYANPMQTLENKSWDANGDGEPDHYFRADNPSKMRDSLSDAFASIASSLVQQSNDFVIEKAVVMNGDFSYASKFGSKRWSGEVSAKRLNFDADGNQSETEVWNTNQTFASQVSGEGWDNNRKIATANCTAKGTLGEKNCTGVPFRFNALTAASQTQLDTVGTMTGVGQDVLNFLRGDRSREGEFRTRDHVLGDIINAQLAVVSPPNAPYSESNNQGYGDFKSSHANRPTMVYAAANDGMLHAFNGATGTETFAYVPHALYDGPMSMPAVNGLAALANRSYRHHFYVDASPSVYDVSFGANNWHTLLIGGLGKGGKSYYALDVTTPQNAVNETDVANKVLWEFSHQDLGFTYGAPIAVKADGKWVVIFTSGYNNTDGKGYFFIVDPQTGSLINKISTGVGSTSQDAGLAHATAYIPDAKSFNADAVYAGDLLGNVWRLDLSGIASAGYTKTPQLLAKLTSSSGSPQPITSSPVVEFDRNTSERMVFIGTGRLLDDSDLPISNKNSFYAIKDGDNLAFFETGTLPSPVSSFPIIPRQHMVDHTDNPNALTPDAAKPMGYYIDLPDGFFINLPMDSAAGIVAVIANKIIGDSCELDALYRGYVLNYASGKSMITNPDNGITTQYYEGQGLGTSVTIYKKPNESTLSVNFSHTGEIKNNSISVTPLPVPFKRLNWRLVPLGF